MEMREGFKKTEAGIIPDDWGVISFSKLFDFKNGVNADKKSYGHGVPFINVLEPITHSHIQSRHITGKVALPKNLLEIYSVRSGDIVFNRTSETPEQVGLAATYIGSETAVFGGFVIRGRPKVQLFDSVFTGYAFRSPEIRSQIVAKGQGAIRANIGQTDLGQVVAPVPPLREQLAISGALGEIDSLILSLEKLITKKRDIKQATMQQLLTGKIRLPGFESKNGYKKSEIGVIPNDWEVKPLKLVSDKIMVGIASAATHAYRKKGIVLLRNQNIKSGYLDDGDILFIDPEYEVSFKNKRLKAGDLLTARTGYPGTTCVVSEKYDSSQSFTTLITRPNSQFINSEYLCHYINSEWGQGFFEKNQIGGGQKNVNAASLREMPILIPSIPEQKAISDILSDMFADLLSLEDKLKKTKFLKQGMMQELLTGRIRLI